MIFMTVIDAKDECSSLCPERTGFSIGVDDSTSILDRGMPGCSAGALKQLCYVFQGGVSTHIKIKFIDCYLRY